MTAPAQADGDGLPGVRSLGWGVWLLAYSMLPEMVGSESLM